jgi:hypothetical protein
MIPSKFIALAPNVLESFRWNGKNVPIKATSAKCHRDKYTEREGQRKRDREVKRLTLVQKPTSCKMYLQKCSPKFF